MKRMEWLEKRANKIIGMIPPDVELVLDIGCGNSKKYFKRHFKNYIGVDLKNADINQDLEKNPKLNLADKSFDCVVLSQILEHLTTAKTVAEEAKRIAKKYILVGLPNDFTLLSKLNFLRKTAPPNKIDVVKTPHLSKYGLKDCDKFVQKFFGDYDSHFYVFHPRISWFPFGNLLASLFPSMFSKEIYYLICIR